MACVMADSSSLSDVQESGVQGITSHVTNTMSGVSLADTDLRPEISVWCDPSELAELALRKIRRPDKDEAARELLDLANGDHTVLREAMEEVVAGETGAATQIALRLLFNAYQLASKH